MMVVESVYVVKTCSSNSVGSQISQFTVHFTVTPCIARCEPSSGVRPSLSVTLETAEYIIKLILGLIPASFIFLRPSAVIKFQRDFIYISGGVK